MRDRGVRWRWLLAVAILAVGFSPTSGAPGETRCDSDATLSIERAEELLANRYQLGSHPVVTLPANPTWREDPLQERNWRFLYHSLRWTETLWWAWEQTGDGRYLERYTFILHDWYAGNPRTRPPSDFSWNDHSTAYRGMAYACALRRLTPWPSWLRSAATLHARTLADPDFYVGRGNHALNQAIGLLDLGCAYGGTAWRDLGASRTEALVRASVDAAGVSNEQSDGYHTYNYNRYRAALARLEACGLRPSSTMRARVGLMPRFMAWVSMPNGRSAMIGDTTDGAILSVPGTEAEFVATGGTSGRRPSSLYRVYSAGYASFRSGWGTARPLADETDVLVRFGGPLRFHGHMDAASVLLYSYGDRIFRDAGGPYRYMQSRWHDYFFSERAHNTVSVDGLAMRREGSTAVLAQRHTTSLDFIALRHDKIPGVRHTRRVLYSRRLNIVLVEDQLAASRSRSFRQWWHLHPNASFRTGAGSFTTVRGGGPNAYVRQIVGGASLRSYRGATSPIQGWITPSYGVRRPARAMAFVDSGRSVRFVTLIVPSPDGNVAATIRSFALRPSGGFALVVRTRGMTAQVLVTATTASERLL